MKTYYDNRGNTVVLEKELGRGGEGAVFSISGNSQLVAKIYHEPPGSEKAEKLARMLELQDERLVKVAAWVTGTLHERDGKVAGFLMPSIVAKEIHELYSLKNRPLHFPNVDWRFLIHAATNLARAFHVVHSHGHALGDVNQGNCVVFRDGTVKLIDCDSYHINGGNQQYLCDVGVATHTPPELQGMPLRGIARTTNHDAFGLAVIIFHLLFIGRHPFIGTYLGKEDKSIEDFIRERLYAYGEDARTRQMRQPPGTLHTFALTPRVAELFRRAFLSIDNRPPAREWIEALEELQQNLQECWQHSGHYYLKTLPACSWCALEAELGIEIFEPSFAEINSLNDFDITTLEQFINNLRVPDQWSAPVVKPASLPASSEETRMVKRNYQRRVIWTGSGGVVFLTVAAFIPSVGVICIGALIVSLISYFLLNSFDRKIKGEINQRFSLAEKSWQSAARLPSFHTTPAQLKTEITQFKNKVTEYQNLDAERLKRIRELEANAYENQKRDYLDRFRIDRANIDKIGWSRAVVLQSFGIETAVDVERYRVLAVPGFGPVYTQKLLDWRSQLERNFKFDPRKGISPQDRQKVNNEINRRRLQLQRELRPIPDRLKLASEGIFRIRQEYQQRLEIAGKEYAQAKSNYQAVNQTIPAFLALFGVFFAASVIGAQINLNLYPSQKEELSRLLASLQTSRNIGNNQASQPSTSVMNGAFAVNGTANSAVNANNNGNANLHANSLGNSASHSDLALQMINTDAAPETFASFEREQMANELFQAGVKLTKRNNYSEAIRFYRKAILFNGSKAEYYHELGYALYRQKNYQESINNLKQAADLTSSSLETRQILAKNYLALQKWSDASDVLQEIVKVRPNSAQTQYQLGIALKNAGQLDSGITALQRAVQLKPDDANYQYDLGLCYVQSELNEEADETYYQLLQLNPALAEKLRQKINSSR